MSNPLPAPQVAQLLGAQDRETLDVLGPIVQMLVEPAEGENAPCLMRGTIPPGVSVPLHSHPDPETFVHLSGELEGLAETGDGFAWLRIASGDVFHVPGDAKHAFRNRSQVPAIGIVVTTPMLGRFFREVGRPVVAGGPPAGPPSAETLERFLETARRYGHWNGTPEENAKVGLSLPQPFQP
jgi:quercetin dioxygenase-like cupin family protein